DHAPRNERIGLVRSSAKQAIRFASIDLTQACYRQVHFMRKIMSNPSLANMDKAQIKVATAKYVRYLMLHKTKPGFSLVPTLDVDVIWHTHMLFPVHYT